MIIMKSLNYDDKQDPNLVMAFQKSNSSGPKFANFIPNIQEVDLLRKTFSENEKSSLANG